jgi:PIN domain nuclease of toxin-antitoxin system
MKTILILDTQTAIWASEKPHYLGKKSQRMISENSEVGISSISVVEFNMKYRRSMKSKSSWSQLLLENDFLIERFGYEAADEMARFGSLVRHDVFDRMILAHAASLNAKFLTSDSVLLGLGLDWLLDSRD